MSAFLEETVIVVNRWTDRLFSFTTNRDQALRFSSGHTVVLRGRPVVPWQRSLEKGRGRDHQAEVCPVKTHIVDPVHRALDHRCWHLSPRPASKRHRLKLGCAAQRRRSRY
jgi:hypothetical protein